MQIKLTACFAIILLLVSSAGCLWLHPTHFNLLSSSVTDTQGFPVLAFAFNLTDVATVTVSDPAGRVCLSQDFFQPGSATAVLGTFRHSPAPGSYSLNVKDAGHNTIFSRTFRWSAPVLSFLSCQQKWFQRSDETVLTLNLTIRNNGQLPSYPHKVQILYGSTIIYGPVIPCVILPEQTTNVNAYIVLPTELSLQSFTVQLLDAEGYVSGSFTQNVTSDVCPSFQVSWSYQGRHLLTLPNVSSLYAYERSLSREPSPDYALYVFNSLDDAYFTYLLHRLVALSGTNDAISQLNFIAGFVQSLTYREDDPLNASFEYPRFPIETLNEQGGDCEDKAILCAQLLTLAGYNVSLIRLPKHMAVGVYLRNLSGFTPYAEGYYYLEATAGSSPVGRVPGEYQGVTNYTLYRIMQRPLLLHEWVNATRYRANQDDYVQVTVLVKNEGSAVTAAEVDAFFYASYVRFGTQSQVIPRLEAGGETQVTLRVNIPNGVATVLKTQVLVNGVVQQEKESASMFP